jgi:hypothetical protein
MVLPGDADDQTRKTKQGLRGDMHTVIGVYADSDEAEEGLVALQDANFPRDNISLVFSHSDAAEEIPSQAASERAGDSAPAGAAIGGVAGGVVAGLVGAGLLAIPGAGPFLAAGWLVSAAGGAGVGAAAGGWVGAMTRIGVPEDVGQRYERQMSEGGWLVMVLTEKGGREQKAMEILDETGARAVDSYPYQVRTDQFPGDETPFDETPYEERPN